MSRKYPRRYAIVQNGETKEVTCKDPVHETAIVLKHKEALGLNRPEPFDNSPLVIESDGEGE